MTQTKTAIEDWENKIHDLTIQKGEKDGNCYRYYLDLNGVLQFPELPNVTDVLFSHVGEDDRLTFCCTTPEDKGYYFVTAGEMPYKVVKEALNQIEKGEPYANNLH